MDGVSLRNYSVTFKDRGGRSRTVLRDVNLSLSANQIVGIIGPSGCGKTTLLKALSGLLALYSNCSTVGHISVLDKSPTELREKRCVSVALQSGGLLPWLTVEENVLFPIRLRGPVTTQDYDAAARLVAAMKLTERKHSYPSELSGGMQQRTAFARVFMADPQVITCDEPLSSVDQITRDDLFSELVFELRRHVLSRKNSINRICFWASHSIEEVILVADTIIVLSQQPTCISAVIQNVLDKDRTIAIADSEDFQRLKRHVKDRLRK